MKYQIIVREAVARDLDNIADFIKNDRPAVAPRFYLAFWEAAQLIAQFPGFGPRRRTRNRNLKALRFWVIRGFENYLIYYRP